VRFWSIAREFARLGHSVFFLERTIKKTGRANGSGIGYYSTVDTGLLWLDILRATLFNIRYGLPLRPHFVFVLKPFPNTCIPALLLKHVFGCKVILDVDDLDFAYYPNGLMQGLVRICFKVFPPRFDFVTTHNLLLQSILVHDVNIVASKIVFLPQGIDTEQFAHAEPNRSYQEKWRLNQRDSVLIYCASLGITSDFEILLPALIEFLGGCDDAQVLVVGDGIKKQHFIGQVAAHGLQERVIFTGYVPHSDMPGVLKLAKVGLNYMAPTLANQCRASIKIREYLAAGLQVVSNPVGETEVFKDYVTLCPRIEDFPKAMKMVLQEGSVARIENVRKFLGGNFSWPLLVEEFLNRVSSSN
jgi:glycosyltransferase involved in cell wall biosynthesis